MIHVLDRAEGMAGAESLGRCVGGRCEEFLCLAPRWSPGPLPPSSLCCFLRVGFSLGHVVPDGVALSLHSLNLLLWQAAPRLAPCRRASSDSPGGVASCGRLCSAPSEVTALL